MFLSKNLCWVKFRMLIVYKDRFYQKRKIPIDSDIDMRAWNNQEFRIALRKLGRKV